MSDGKLGLLPIRGVLLVGLATFFSAPGLAQDTPVSPGGAGSPSPPGASAPGGGTGTGTEVPGSTTGGAPGSSIFRGLRIVPSVTFRETFTDNVDLDPDGEKDPALISEITPSIDLALRSARIAWGLNGGVTLRYTALNDEGFTTDADLATALTAEIVEELFFVDAAASVSQELLDSEDGSSASDANTNNLETVQTYLLSPYLVNRFGTFARSQLRYSVAYGNFGGDDASDTIDNQASLSVEAGPDFTTYIWGVNAFAAHQSRDDDDDVERGSAEANLQVVLTSGFSLLGAGGYNKFDDGDDNNEVDEPLWEGGFRWTPSPRTELIATYGERDGIMAPRSRLIHAFTPRTRVIAEYSETLNTSQELFFDNIRDLTLDDEGRLAERETSLAFNPSPTNLSIDDETAETKRASINFLSTLGRNAFDVGGTYEDENTLSEDDDDDDEGGEDELSYGANASWTRRFNPSWSGTLFGGFTRSEFRDAENQKDNEYTASFTLIYSIVPGADLAGSYTFRLQDSTDPEDEFTENAVSVGITLSF